MKNNKLFSLSGLILTLACLLPGLVAANSHWFIPKNIKLDTRVVNFEFKEFDEAGHTLVRENGALYGVNLEADFNWRGVYFHARGYGVQGMVDYKGHQIHTKRSHETTTKQTILNLGMRLGKIYRSWRSEDFAVIYAGFGVHQWVRDIQSRGGVIGLYEFYAWPFAEIGATGFVYKKSRHHLKIDLNLSRSIRPTMRVDFKGKYASKQLKLGEHYGARVSLPFSYRWTKHSYLSTNVYLESWDLGRSPHEPLTDPDGFEVDAGVHEPRSATLLTGLELGWRYQF
ncbi:MAG: hypothetical protein OEZ58_10685 [Gammaproteobacteria bacterium]|nr:hypothetical protein [Gammaproteobacteria bacterium]MDH5729447.1 hypothetical protein [Gammaproteobacteria bacterium]